MAPVKAAKQAVVPAVQAARTVYTADDENEEADNDDLDADPSYTERSSSRRRKRSAAKTERRSAKKAKVGLTGKAATIELLTHGASHVAGKSLSFINTLRSADKQSVFRDALKAARDKAEGRDPTRRAEGLLPYLKDEEAIWGVARGSSTDAGES